MIEPGGCHPEPHGRTEFRAKVVRPRSPLAFAGMGIEIAAPIVLFMYVGYRMDGWLDSAPWLFLTGSMLGIVLGFYNLFRRALPSKQDREGRGE